MATKPPVEVPQGAIRLNTDSQKLEFYAQDQWWEMATDTPILEGGARGFFAGGGKHDGSSWSASNVINMVTIPTTGNATDFGDLTQGQREIGGSAASRTRAIRAGGGEPTNTDTIDYWTMAQQGNAVDFGNLTATFMGFGASVAGSQTRGVFAFSYDSGRNNTDVIEYVTIATTGNAVDFGNQTIAKHTQQCSSSPTRTLIWGGMNPARKKIIDYVNTASTGNAQDFGDLSIAQSRAGVTGNSTRGIFAGGEQNSPVGLVTLAQSIQYDTLGTAVEFGNVVGKNVEYASACSSPIRALWGGGSGGPSGVTGNNVISYRTIATCGDGLDFGDLTNGAQSRAAMSNAHGGL